MKISIALQTLVFLKAVLLGATLGVVYDLLRAVRRTARAGVALTAAMDGVFWLFTLIALFVFVLTAADGEGRGYILLGTSFGAALYFLTCSPPLTALFGLLAHTGAKILQFPCNLLKKARAVAEKLKNKDKPHKKIKETLKKHFHFGPK